MSDGGRTWESRREQVVLRRGLLFTRARRPPGSPGHRIQGLVDAETDMIVRAEPLIQQAFGLDQDEGDGRLNPGLPSAP